MNYNLYQTSEKSGQKQSTFASIKKLLELIKEERRTLIIAFAAILINAILSLLGPFLIGHTIDTYFVTKQYHGILLFSGILVALYIIAFFANYLQMRLMGGRSRTSDPRKTRPSQPAQATIDDPFADDSETQSPLTQFQEGL